VLERGQTLEVAESGEWFYSMVPAGIQLLELGAGLWAKRDADKIHRAMGEHGHGIHVSTERARSHRMKKKRNLFKDQNMDGPASPAKELIAL
jgi:hypothetical protein